MPPQADVATALSKVQDTILAEHIFLQGVVQGVGMRPTIFRLAKQFELAGWVKNCNTGVELVVSGEPEKLGLFQKILLEQLPPLSKIDSMKTCTHSYARSTFPQGFDIRNSDERSAQAKDAVVGCDAAICDNCRRELNDPGNRRYHYPFTQCTDCGPRFSITRSLPFDRQNTSMAAFPLCTDCEAEYTSPADRRFHAQAICCAACGPRLTLVDKQGNSLALLPAETEMQAAARLLKQGNILAIKGLGGFHLACLAADENVLRTLRERKQRPTKPFALMALDIRQIKKYATLTSETEALLTSTQAPIVLLQKLPATNSVCLPELLAPAQNNLGFMLPYTPLHLLLMQEVGAPLVMTSGNKHGEPQCTQNDEALEKLAGIADFFLLHDRDIVHRLDDSVVKPRARASTMLRRARAYAPHLLPASAEVFQHREILAMGGEQKNTLCWVRNNRPLLSAYNGDLYQVDTFKAFKQTLHELQTTFQFIPGIIAVDKHPGYHASQLGIALAEQNGLSVVSVQHHHAHIASCMLENGIKPNTGKVLGIVLDGSGYGDDGSIWGGEFILADYSEAERCGHFQAFPLPGGEQAVLQPWRNAYAQLASMDWRKLVIEFSDLECIQKLQSKPLQLIDRLIANKLNAPLCSSAGRVFDAAAAMLGLCFDAISFEGEAAMQLEALATPHYSVEVTKPYPWGVQAGCLSWQPTWLAMLKELKAGVAKGKIAARFHQTLARAVSELAIELCKQKNVSTVALSGGVFQNSLLLEACVYFLEQAKLRVLTHTHVPANDGGIALGQAAIAAQKKPAVLQRAFS